jgi:hypothetical protein
LKRRPDVKESYVGTEPRGSHDDIPMQMNPILGTGPEPPMQSHRMPHTLYCVTEHCASAGVFFAGVFFGVVWPGRRAVVDRPDQQTMQEARRSPCKRIGTIRRHTPN